MKQLLSVSVTFLLLVIPAQVFAKGQTVKITIKGADLNPPVEITDPKVLTEFQVWSGPGTSSSVPGFNPNAPGFIVDWSQAGQSPQRDSNATKCPSTRKCRMSDSSMLCSMSMIRRQNTGTYTCPVGLTNGIGSM